MNRRGSIDTLTLNEVRTRFESVRQNRCGKQRIPEELWPAAIALAGRNGVNPTATALHLDGGKLKRQMVAANSAKGSGWRGSACQKDVSSGGRPAPNPFSTGSTTFARKIGGPYQTCVAGIDRLAAFGHELRRPLADLLRDGIHEIGIRKGRVNYRVVFFPRTGLGDLRSCNHERGRRAGGRDRAVHSLKARVRIGSRRTHVFGGGLRLIMARTKDAVKILDRVTGQNPAVRAGIANARINLEVAQMIYDARTKAGMSQRELAELIGSRQSVIALLEDADYDGHSLSRLQRIGSALRQRIELRLSS